MTRTTFDLILGNKFRVDFKSVTSVLCGMGYRIGNNPHGLQAIKWVNNHRYHFSIDQLPDGEINRFCSIDFHIDNGSGLFHSSKSKGEEVKREFDKFINLLNTMFAEKHKANIKRERKKKYRENQRKRMESYEFMFRWM